MSKVGPTITALSFFMGLASGCALMTRKSLALPRGEIFGEPLSDSKSISPPNSEGTT